LAIGGHTALRGLQDFKLGLLYSEGSFSAQSTLAQARPYFRLVSVPAGPLTKDSILEGYDGAAWEYYGDPGVVLRTVAGAGAIARRNAHQFIDPLVEAADNGLKLTYAGQRTVDGNRVFVIRARYSDATEDDVFVDYSSYLIDGLDQDIQFHAFGKNLPTHIEMSDYRPVGGVLMPFHTRQIDDATGKVIDSSSITSAQANIGLAAAYFEPPVFTRTPLQAMIESLYQERDDVAGVLQTYGDYRRLYGDQPSTLDAIDFIGYQCLKTGSARTAVALLSANVSDYPESPRAHFGLGRALVGAGEIDRAKAEFERALKIQPSYKPASDALAALH